MNNNMEQIIQNEIATCSNGILSIFEGMEQINEIGAQWGQGSIEQCLEQGDKVEQSLAVINKIKKDLDNSYIAICKLTAIQSVISKSGENK